MREFVNKFGVFIISGALVLAAIVYFFFFSGGPPKTGDPSKAWFIDEEDNTESVQASTEVPPLPGKKGDSVVREVRISCDNGRNAKVVWYSRYVPAAKEAILRLRGSKESEKDRQLQDAMSRGEQIRSPEAGSKWVFANTPEGEKIRNAADCTNGNTALAVSPP